MCLRYVHISHTCYTSVLLARQGPLVQRAGLGLVFIPSHTPCCPKEILPRSALSSPHIHSMLLIHCRGVSATLHYLSYFWALVTNQAPSWNNCLQQPKQVSCTQTVRRMGREFIWAAARFCIWVKTFDIGRQSLCVGTCIYIYIYVYVCLYGSERDKHCQEMQEHHMSVQRKRSQ